MVDEMRLADGLPWSIPVTLATDVGRGRGRPPRAARRRTARLLGVIDVEEVFERDLEREARHVYRTTDTEHPGVAALQRGGRRAASPAPCAPSTCPEHPEAFRPYLLPPAASRAAFAERGWKTVVGFQTRNPIHRAHEYITKAALESVDGLFIHPLVGETKSDDIPADVRMRCYEALIEHYYRAGPRAARDQPGRDALRRPARGDLPRPDPQELRLHPLHRRPRPRRRGRLLRHLRRPGDLRRVRPRGAGHRAD